MAPRRRLRHRTARCDDRRGNRQARRVCELAADSTWRRQHVWGSGPTMMANYHLGFTQPNCFILERPVMHNPLEVETLVEPLQITDGDLIHRLLPDSVSNSPRRSKPSIPTGAAPRAHSDEQARSHFIRRLPQRTPSGERNALSQPPPKRPARAAILSSAMHIIAKRGERAATFRAVAAAAGVSHSLLQHHFGTKRRLVAAVERMVAERFSAALATTATDAQVASNEMPPGCRS